MVVSDAHVFPGFPCSQEPMAEEVTKFHYNYLPCIVVMTGADGCTVNVGWVTVEIKHSRIRIQQPFSSSFFVSKICKLECNMNSDWINRMV